MAKSPQSYLRNTLFFLLLPFISGILSSPGVFGKTFTWVGDSDPPIGNICVRGTAEAQLGSQMPAFQGRELHSFLASYSVRLVTCQQAHPGSAQDSPF